MTRRQGRQAGYGFAGRKSTSKARQNATTSEVQDVDFKGGLSLWKYADQAGYGSVVGEQSNDAHLDLAHKLELVRLGLLSICCCCRRAKCPAVLLSLLTSSRCPCGLRFLGSSGHVRPQRWCGAVPLAGSRCCRGEACPTVSLYRLQQAEKHCFGYCCPFVWRGASPRCNVSWLQPPPFRQSGRASWHSGRPGHPSAGAD